MYSIHRFNQYLYHEIDYDSFDVDDDRITQVSCNDIFDDDVDDDDDDDDDDKNRTKKNDDDDDKTNETFPMETTKQQQQQQQQQDHNAVPCKTISEGVYAYADLEFKILE